VSEILLWGVTTGRRAEVDWLFRGGASIFFPREWERLRDAIPARHRAEDITDAYRRWLNDPDPSQRRRAVLEWCMWESATPTWPPRSGLAGRFEDPRYAFAFARIVTHYMSHNLWLHDEGVLPKVRSLQGIPGILVHGRFDFQAPVAWAWELHRRWPTSQLQIVEEAGHDGSSSGVAHHLVRATDSYRTT
jgi:proline iminopeptidase